LDKQKYLKYINLGFKYYKQGQFERAYKIFSICIRITPKDYRIYYYAGRCLYSLKSYNQSISFFLSSNSLKNDYRVNNYYLGKNLIVLKRYDEAIQVLIENSKYIEQSGIYLGLVYLNIGQIENSLKWFKNIYINYKDDFRVINGFSLALYKAGMSHFNNDIKLAKEYILKAIEVNKELYPAYYMLGMIYGFENDYNNSKKCFEILINKYPSNEALISVLGHIYNRTGDITGLKKIFGNYYKNSSDDMNKWSEYLKIIGLSLFNQKKYKDAIPYFLKLYLVKSYDDNILLSLALCRIATGETQKALNIYKILIEHNKTRNIKVINSYILLLIRLGRYKDARDKALDCMNKQNYGIKTLLYYYYSSVYGMFEANNEEIYKVLRNKLSKNRMFIEATAFKLLNSGRINKAVSLYYKIYKFDPKDTYILSEIVDLLLKKNLKEQAIHYLNKIYQIDTNNKDVVYYYSWSLICLGKIEEAINVLEASPSDYKIDYLLGNGYRILGDEKKSYKFYYSSFKKNPLYTANLYQLLRIYYKCSKYHAANKIINFISISNPQFIRVDIYRALVNLKMNKPEKSLENIKNYYKKNKNTISPYLKTITYLIQYKLGYYKILIPTINTNIKNKKASPSELIIKALILRKNYDTEKLRETEKSLETFKNSPCVFEYYKKFYGKKTVVSDNRKDLGLRLSIIF